MTREASASLEPSKQNEICALLSSLGHISAKNTHDIERELTRARALVQDAAHDLLVCFQRISKTDAEAQEAARLMQFADLTNQILQHVEAQVQRLPSLIATLEQQAREPIDMQALLRTIQAYEAKVPHRAVEQTSMNAG
ncbi:MAG: hypothetical protein AAFN74_18995, partial [Myxococcota bacterium]